MVVLSPSATDTSSIGYVYIGIGRGHRGLKIRLKTIGRGHRGLKIQREGGIGG